MAGKKLNMGKIFGAILWVLFAAGAVFLLVSASHGRSSKTCKGIAVSIRSIDNNFLLDKAEMAAEINKVCGRNASGMLLKDIPVQEIETILKGDTWVKDANVYFDNNGLLHADIEEREPIAHIFSMDGNGFYLDSNLLRLSQTERYAPRLPVFTGFPNEETGKLTPRDSNLLAQIKIMTNIIRKDSFLMAMIDQVDIQNYQFEMVPKLGKQLIVFGDTTAAENKMKKLKLFYKEVMASAGGWNKYSVIDVSYKDQVVATQRGKEDIRKDSLRTLQLLEIIAKNASLQASDSLPAVTAKSEKANTTSVSMISQSIERDEEPEEGDEVQAPEINNTVPEVKAVVPPPAPKVVKQAPSKTTTPAVKKTETVVKKPAVTKPATTKPKTTTTTKQTTTKKPQKLSAEEEAIKNEAKKNSEPAKKQTEKKTNSSPKVVMPKKDN